MSSASISLIGMYMYNDTLFDLLNVPDGIDKDTLINTILLRGGEYEVIYPRYEFLKQAIGVWSNSHQHLINKWLEVYNKEFDPLENYDRQESSLDVTESSGTNDTNTTDSTSNNSNNNSSNTGEISAYDSHAFSNQDRDTSSSTTSGSASSSGTTSNEYDHEESVSHTARIHGNIGVTTSAQMYKEYWELQKQYGNIYDAIAVIFLQDFIIPI